jgi:hypothetical protein
MYIRSRKVESYKQTVAHGKGTRVVFDPPAQVKLYWETCSYLGIGIWNPTGLQHPIATLPQAFPPQIVERHAPLNRKIGGVLLVREWIAAEQFRYDSNLIVQ